MPSVNVVLMVPRGLDVREQSKPLGVSLWNKGRGGGCRCPMRAAGVPGDRERRGGHLERSWEGSGKKGERPQKASFSYLALGPTSDDSLSNI